MNLEKGRPPSGGALESPREKENRKKNKPKKKLKGLAPEGTQTETGKPTRALNPLLENGDAPSSPHKIGRSPAKKGKIAERGGDRRSQVYLEKRRGEGRKRKSIPSPRISYDELRVPERVTRGDHKVGAKASPPRTPRKRRPL